MTHTIDILPAWPMLLAFLTASLVLAVTPGPGVFYIVSRSLAQGPSAGFASVAGVALGNLGNAVGASLGLAAIFVVSSTAFSVVKYAGAAYLIYLGIQALRKVDAAAGDSSGSHLVAASRIFIDGFAVALLNPKTALFFAAFLPQFLSGDVNPFAQSLALSALFVSSAAVTDTIYALTAARAARFLARRLMWRASTRYLTGSTLVGLGLFTAFSDARNDK
ncbi:MAG TPA: LysE family translocator [Burkholderiales bacterium]|nr:LysE family translocator [Burkholderiales bacterium]